MKPHKSSIAGSLLISALLTGIILWGFAVYFEVGSFSDPASINTALKVLVGTLVSGFFLTILFDDDETQAVATAG